MSEHSIAKLLMVRTCSSIATMVHSEENNVTRVSSTDPINPFSLSVFASLHMRDITLPDTGREGLEHLITDSSQYCLRYGDCSLLPQDAPHPVKMKVTPGEDPKRIVNQAGRHPGQEAEDLSSIGHQLKTDGPSKAFGLKTEMMLAWEEVDLGVHAKPGDEQQTDEDASMEPEIETNEDFFEEEADVLANLHLKESKAYQHQGDVGRVRQPVQNGQQRGAGVGQQQVEQTEVRQHSPVGYLHHRSAD